MRNQEIERLIRSLGIGATYRGYRYLSYGVELCLSDENYLLSVSKLLYPQIAKTFSTTSSVWNGIYAQSLKSAGNAETVRCLRI